MSRSFDTIPWLSDFPAGLDKKTDPTDLKDGFSPDSFGLALDADQRLAKGTIPSGTARVKKTFTIGADTFPWFYNRLWKFDSANVLEWGARHYDAVFQPQSLSKVSFDEDAENIIEILPFGGDNLAVMKSTGSYVFGNLNDTREFFSKTDIIQEVNITAAANTTELDDVVYASGANGLFAFAGGEVRQITRLVRDDVANFANKALTVDYEKKRIIGASSFVYDVELNRLFDFTTSGFRYTSPQYRQDDFSPFMVERIVFIIEFTDTDEGEFTLQVKYEDEDFTDEEIHAPTNDVGAFTTFALDLGPREQVRKFQIRINDMSDNLRIRRINLDISPAHFDDY